MSNDPLKPEYFDYYLYVKVKDKFKQCNYIEDNKDRFNNIITKVFGKHVASKWSDKFLTCLHNYLAIHNGFMDFEVKDYCRYINFWLNREVRKKEYEKYRQDFNIFQKFSHEYAYEKQKHYNDSCKKYIHYMEEADYNRMKLLYDFFDMYINLNSDNNWVREKECKNLLSNTAIYNDAIDDYYVNHRDLYDKISHVKDSIEKVIKNPDKKCEQDKTFRIPQKLLDEQKKEELDRMAEQRKQEAESVRRRQEAEENERRRREAEAANRQSTQRIQQDLEPQRGIPQMHTPHYAQREILQPGDSLGSVELENPGETLHLEEQDPSNLLRPRLRLRNSGRYEDSQERAIGQPYGDQLGKGVHKQESEGTSTDGSFLGSSGFPGYITEVFRSVEPAPILGVSGGMGALFLLFKYTPVGSFFGGRRGRFRQIPRTFNGPFPGDFPNFNEYEGGYIGYGPMNINPLAE